ncbi:MAG TPA: serine/threonine-protein kinase, partial [Anaerolineales bacterium]|nr:serine/threonine-protein kinase [Anaerolineales bacterium]
RRSVAIKLVSVNLQENLVFRERFEREAQLIARIEHPAIVPVYDFGEQNNQPYLVMRYMTGGALASRIKEGALPLAYAAQILTQIAPALDAVHAQGIVHRDLKPANILLDGFGNPAISDFGIAHFTQATTDLTGSAIIGTPSYMSPEQVRSDVDLDGRSDVYALGIILFEMLTGNGPFRAPTPLSVAMKHLTDPIPSILPIRSDLPVDVDRILHKALAKDREARYASASELAFELRGISDTVRQEGKPVTRPIATVRKEDLLTEVDTGEEFGPALAPSISSQPASGQTASQTSKTMTPSSRSSIPRIAGLTGTGAVLCLLFVCIAIGAVGLWSRPGLPAFDPGQNPTGIPSAATANTSDPQEVVLYSDDFSNPSSGWPTIQNVQGEYSYQSDGYHINVSENGAVLWAKTSEQFDDSSVYVDAGPLRQGENGYYGILCRIEDNRNFYYFVIQNTGEYTIGKYKNGGFESLVGGWRQSDEIHPDTETNRLQADCIEDTLRLYVNDVFIDEVTNTDFNSGYSGILAAALESQRYEVLFNNFLITEPDQ